MERTNHSGEQRGFPIIPQRMSHRTTDPGKEASERGWTRDPLPTAQGTIPGPSLHCTERCPEAAVRSDTPATSLAVGDTELREVAAMS